MIRRHISLLAVAALLIPGIGIAQASQPSREGEQPCNDYQAQRQVLFGDLHVHTKYSLDASTQGTRTSPADAYRFAKGEKIDVQPWRADGSAMRSLQLDRPLDFAAVTDHAELFGEVEICTTPSAAGYESWQCKLYRNYPRAAFFLFNTKAAMTERLGFCGGDVKCRENGLRPWTEMQAAAEEAYDRSANCRFTSFVAYEWTGASENLSNLHRNIIFKNAQVPRLPLSFIDAPDAKQLLDGLDRECVDAEGDCGVLVIPHNSNLSDGYMFQTVTASGQPISSADAKQRARFERLVEVMQHKGSSECYFDPLASEDELCAFEQLPYDQFRSKFLGKITPLLSAPPAEDAGFIRQVLRDGMSEQQRLGSNPFKLGFIASSDTHISAPGAVDEKKFLGHGGAGEPASVAVPVGLPDDIEFNPGGLAAVWAEQNNRESIYAALQRRETFGTSGPRIGVRFFGGWDISEDICSDQNYAAQAYNSGVPMGGDLVANDNGTAPLFTVMAAMDAVTGGQGGVPLQRIQIVKSTVDKNGREQEQVFEVAGNANSKAGVDLLSCKPFGEGYSQLCGVWRDPTFNKDQHAYYYARVLENPSCRWSQHICAAQKVDCSRPESITDGFAACCSTQHRPSIQERAWTSPIWYTPDPVKAE